MVETVREGSAAGNGVSRLPALLRDRAVGWGGAAGEAWLADLPRLVADLAQRWGLVLGAPFDTHVSFAARVRRGDQDAVLKAPMVDHYERASTALERSLLDDALEVLAELVSMPDEPVLLHGDLHHMNVLSAGREPWLAIDPLPRVGDPCYDAVQFLLFRKGSTPDPAASWDRDIKRFCQLVMVDADRVKKWLFARLVSDTVADLMLGIPREALEAYQEDLWSARLVRHLL